MNNLQGRDSLEEGDNPSPRSWLKAATPISSPVSSPRGRSPSAVPSFSSGINSDIPIVIKKLPSDEKDMQRSHFSRSQGDVTASPMVVSGLSSVPTDGLMMKDRSKESGRIHSQKRKKDNRPRFNTVSALSLSPRTERSPYLLHTGSVNNSISPRRFLASGGREEAGQASASGSGGHSPGALEYSWDAAKPLRKRPSASSVFERSPNSMSPPRSRTSSPVDKFPTHVTSGSVDGKTGSPVHSSRNTKLPAISRSLTHSTMRVNSFSSIASTSSQHTAVANASPNSVATASISPRRRKSSNKSHVRSSTAAGLSSFARSRSPKNSRGAQDGNSESPRERNLSSSDNVSLPPYPRLSSLVDGDKFIEYIPDVHFLNVSHISRSVREKSSNTKKVSMSSAAKGLQSTKGESPAKRYQNAVVYSGGMWISQFMVYFYTPSSRWPLVGFTEVIIPKCGVKKVSDIEVVGSVFAQLVLLADFRTYAFGFRRHTTVLTEITVNPRDFLCFVNKEKNLYESHEGYDVGKEMKRYKLSKEIWNIEKVNSNFSLCHLYPEDLILPHLHHKKLGVTNNFYKEYAPFFEKNRFPVVVWAQQEATPSITTTSHIGSTTPVGTNTKQKRGCLRLLLRSTRLKEGSTVVSVNGGGEGEGSGEGPGEGAGGSGNGNSGAEAGGSDGVGGIRVRERELGIRKGNIFYYSIWQNMYSFCCKYTSERADDIYLKVMDVGEYHSSVRDTFKQYLDIEFCYISDMLVSNCFAELHQCVLQKRSLEFHAFLNALESIQWIELQNNVMRVVSKVLKWMEDPICCVILQSPGEGYTIDSVISVLVQIARDPYYRTIEGFCVLLDKEWVSFAVDLSMVELHSCFYLLVNLLYNAVVQYPVAFEFTETLLVFDLECLLSRRFETFCFSDLKARKESALRGPSLWSYLSQYSNTERFLNPIYSPSAPLPILFSNDEPYSCIHFHEFVLQSHELIHQPPTTTPPHQLILNPSVTTTGSRSSNNNGNNTVNSPSSPRRQSNSRTMELKSEGLVLSRVFISSLLRFKVPSSEPGDQFSLSISSQYLESLSTPICSIGNLTSLSLSGNRFTIIPTQIYHLAHLKSLDFSDNRLTQLPSREHLTHLAHSLTSLNVSFNPMRVIPKSIEVLTNLSTLQASNCQLYRVSPALFASCQQLSMLDLKHNFLSNLPPISLLAPLSSDKNRSGTYTPHSTSSDIALVDLDLSYNQLTHLTSFAHCCNLRTLNLAVNKLAAFPPDMSHLVLLKHLNLSKNSLISISMEIGHCSQLIELDVSHNLISEVPASLRCCGDLSSFDASFNYLKSLPTIGFCRNLKSINVSNNKLSSISACLAQLNRLTHLDVSHNQLTQIPPALAPLAQNLRVFDLSSNPSLLSPPPKIVKSGMSQVFAYLKEQMKGEVEAYRMKIMVVGQENVGKTSLIRTLARKWMNEDEDTTTSPRTNPLLSTDGVDIQTYRFKRTAYSGSNAVGGKKKGVFSSSKKVRHRFHLNFWDFAGQQVYYTTHQFFLSHNALYIFVYSLLDPTSEARMSFWLRSLRSHVKRVKLLIVATHLESASLIPEEAEIVMNNLAESVRSRFGEGVKLYGCTAVSNVTGTNISPLRDTILQLVLKHSDGGRVLVPQSFLMLEELLMDYRKEIALFPVISRGQCLRFAALCGVDSSAVALSYIKRMHDYGEVLFFEDDPVLCENIILSPVWITKMMASLFTTTHSWVKAGLLPHAYLPQIWKHYPPAVYAHLLHLLSKFQVTFVLSSTHIKSLSALFDIQQYQWQNTTNNIYNGGIDNATDEEMIPGLERSMLKFSDTLLRPRGTNGAVLEFNYRGYSLIPDLLSSHEGNHPPTKLFLSRMGPVLSAMTARSSHTSYSTRRESSSSSSGGGASTRSVVVVNTKSVDGKKHLFSRFFRSSFLPYGFFSRLIYRFLSLGGQVAKLWSRCLVLKYDEAELKEDIGEMADESGGEGVLVAEIGPTDLLEEGEFLIRVAHTSLPRAEVLFSLALDAVEVVRQQWKYISWSACVPITCVNDVIVAVPVNNLEKVAIKGESTCTLSLPYTYVHPPSVQPPSHSHPNSSLSPSMSKKALNTSSSILRTAFKDYPIVTSTTPRGPGTTTVNTTTPASTLVSVEIGVTNVAPDIALALYRGKRIGSSQLGVEDLKGSGSYADVYCASYDGGKVAVKVFKNQIVSLVPSSENRNPDAKKNISLHSKQSFSSLFWEYRREILILSQLQHHNIVQLMGICLEPFALIMEYCQLGDLYTLLHSSQKLSWLFRLNILQDVAEGLEYLHRGVRPIIHLDVKSPNILVAINQSFSHANTATTTTKTSTSPTKPLPQSPRASSIKQRSAPALPFAQTQRKDGDRMRDNESNCTSNRETRWFDGGEGVCGKLTDFGTSRVLLTPSTTDFPAIDNPLWLAPEILSRQPYNAAVDVYSFGIVMWEVWSRDKLYGDLTFLSDVVDRVVRGYRPPIGKNCPSTYKDLLTQCWSHKPSVRPSWSTILKKLQIMLKKLGQGDQEFAVHPPESPVTASMVVKKSEGERSGDVEGESLLSDGGGSSEEGEGRDGGKERDREDRDACDTVLKSSSVPISIEKVDSNTSGSSTNNTSSSSSHMGTLRSRSSRFALKMINSRKRKSEKAEKGDL